MAYTPKYQEKIENGMKTVENGVNFQYSEEKPTYQNRYSDTLDKLIDEAISPQTFTYDKDADPNYQALRKEYLREGKRATEDAIGRAAAANGGAISSYGVTAATQAGNYYAGKLADAVPTLYEQAYNRFLDEYSRKLNALSVVQGQEQTDYDRHRNDVADWGAEREFQYGQAVDNYQAAQNALSMYKEADDNDYARYLDRQTAYSGGTKPQLTAAQAKEALENGVDSEAIRAAYKYYYGVDWTPEPAGDEEGNDEGSDNDIVDDGDKGDIPAFDDYAKAVAYMKKAGVPAKLAESALSQNSYMMYVYRGDATQTYAEYLADFVQYQIDQLTSD